MAKEQQAPRGKRSGAEMAKADGREAFAAKRDRDDVPSGWRTGPGLRAAWLDGYDEAQAAAQRAAIVRVQEPPIVTQTADLSARRSEAPACVKCGRTRMADEITWALKGSHRHSQGGMWRECRACGSREIYPS